MKLSLAHVKDIQNDAIAKIAQHCKGLKEVELTDCILIEDPAILALVEASQNLEMLDLEGCLEVTQVVVFHC